MPTTKLTLVTGEPVEIEGSASDITRELEDAARSTSGTLAWLQEAGTRQTIGVNPTHVVLLRSGDG